MADSGQYPFRDSSGLTRWTRSLLYAQIFVSVIALFSGYLEYDFLIGVRDGVFESQETAEAAAAASDSRQSIVGMVQLLVYIVAGILILRWIHRANWNARAFGAQNLQFTPGWSIGWYFVPVFNLWKPYHAMSEIWKATAAPAAWQTQSVPALVGLWWLLWIVASILGNASFRMSLRAEELHEYITANNVTLLSDLVELPLCMVLLILMSRITAMQQTAGGARATA